MTSNNDSSPFRTLISEISDMAAQICIPILGGGKDDALALADAKWALANALQPRPNSSDVKRWNF